ncbi:hypothetical protein MuYL_2108 [Mucilaginibacter xinganensis]|uniref:Uncharacterized protein n=1 Tax=Mucilaginibacter xinganensis TaxID=1234841 RepID=A0A223NWM2_9SPHI|nr:hypothetical protein MuYL_2108 [Mucilaginibacter xinganensis]
MIFITAKVITYLNVTAYLWVTTNFLPPGNPSFALNYPGQKPLM